MLNDDFIPFRDIDDVNEFELDADEFNNTELFDNWLERQREDYNERSKNFKNIN